MRPITNDFRNIIINRIIRYTRRPGTSGLHIAGIGINNSHLLSVIYNTPGYHRNLHITMTAVNTILPNSFGVGTTGLHNRPSRKVLYSFSRLKVSSSRGNVVRLPTSTPVNASVHRCLGLSSGAVRVDIAPGHTSYLNVVNITHSITILGRLPLIRPRVIPINTAVSSALPVTMRTPSTYPHCLNHIMGNVGIGTPAPL